jgi:hypothetical protein
MYFYKMLASPKSFPVPQKNKIFSPFSLMYEHLKIQVL